MWGLCNKSSISRIYLIAPSLGSPSLCPQELPGCLFWLLPSGSDCDGEVLEVCSCSGCPLAVPQQLSHGHILTCPGVFLKQTPRKQRLPWLCGLGDLLTPGFAGSELASSITSGAGMDEGWDFGEIRKSCLGFSITQAGGYTPKFCLCGQWSRNISSGKTSESHGPIWQQFSPQDWIWMLQLQPAAVGLQ